MSDDNIASSTGTIITTCADFVYTPPLLRPLQLTEERLITIVFFFTTRPEKLVGFSRVRIVHLGQDPFLLDIKNEIGNEKGELWRTMEPNIFGVT